jgi:hypothetical protein
MQAYVLNIKTVVADYITDIKQFFTGSLTCTLLSEKKRFKQLFLSQEGAKIRHFFIGRKSMYFVKTDLPLYILKLTF